MKTTESIFSSTSVLTPGFYQSRSPPINRILLLNILKTEGAVFWKNCQPKRVQLFGALLIKQVCKSVKLHTYAGVYRTAHEEKTP